jgi:plastocyanin
MKFSQLVDAKNWAKNRVKNWGKKNQEEAAKQNPESENQEEEITGSTKIKVVAALLVVGFATYVAWWVQEPSDIRADVLAVTQESAQPASTEMAMAESSTNSHETAVSIQDFAFTPSEVNVKAGDTVTWTNKDSVPHTVTGENFSSGTLNSGESYSYTFNDLGAFNYKCSFHPQMTGLVNVDSVVDSATTEAAASEEVVSTELLVPAVTETALEFDTTADFETAAPVLETAVVATSAAANGSVITFPGDDVSVTGDTSAAHAASEQTSLAKSGPEDILYVGLFAAILYFNRKKLASALR